MLTTERLVLRQWQGADAEPFAALNADPAVMRHFPAALDRAQSDAAIDRYQQHIQLKGFGFWATALKSTGAFIGFIGINTLKPYLPMAPGIEIGWRLAQPFWHQGYATEGARAALDHAFNALAIAEVWAITTQTNVASQAVMLRLGMRDTQTTFMHPDLPAEHPLALHRTYRISAAHTHTAQKAEPESRG